MTNVFISGITSGIGKALAFHYAAQGRKVFGLGRQELNYSHDNIIYKKIDLFDLESIEKNLLLLLGDSANIHLVILNAAVLGRIDRLELTSIDELKAQMDINLWSQKILIETIARTNPYVKQIVGISSGAAMKGELGWNGYSISKVAFNMLIELYACEYPHIHFIALAPGVIDTPMQIFLNEQASKNNISSVVPIQSLREAGLLKSPDDFAQLFSVAIHSFRKFQSGSYVDMRHLEEACNIFYQA